MKLSPKLKKGIIIFLLVGFFLGLNLTLIAEEVRNFFYSISLPLQRIFWRAGDRVSDFFETISEIKNLKKENEELKFKIQELLAENTSLKELKKENEILREALDVGLRKEFKLTIAEVIGKDISQDSLIINKGSKDGISKGFPVITQQKILLGKISQVYENFSKVMLISHKESSFDVRIVDSEIQGLVRGNGNLKIYLDFVLSEKEIKVGDLLVTSALGGIFPEGLLVGEIKEIKKLDIESFQKAEIKPAFDIKEIERLFIIVSF